MPKKGQQLSVYFVRLNYGDDIKRTLKINASNTGRALYLLYANHLELLKGLKSIKFTNAGPMSKRKRMIHLKKKLGGQKAKETAAKNKLLNLKNEE